MKNWMKRLSWIAVGLACLALADVAVAGDGGLGSHWPNAADASAHPNLHAYKWQQGDVEYVQINDASGVPLMAIATNGKTVLVLPIGSPDLVHVVSATASPNGQNVYSDGAVNVQVSADGFSVKALGTCTDPVECSKPNVVEQSSPDTTTPTTTTTTTKAAVTALGCNDPIECSKPVQ